MRRKTDRLRIPTLEIGPPLARIDSLLYLPRPILDESESLDAAAEPVFFMLPLMADSRHVHAIFQRLLFHT